MSEERTDVGDETFVAFEVSGKLFGFPMRSVVEVTRPASTVAVPLTSAALVGLTNLRGVVLPIVRLDQLLGFGEEARGEASRFVILDGDQRLGIQVSRVSGVVRGRIASADCVWDEVNRQALEALVCGAVDTDSGGTVLVLDPIGLASYCSGLSTETRESVGRAARSAGFTGPQAEANQDGGNDIKVVQFIVGGAEYAMNVAFVSQVVRMPTQLMQWPLMPPSSIGMASVREETWPLLSLAKCLGRPPSEATEQSRVLLVQPGDSRPPVGMVVDEVREIRTIGDRSLGPIPGFMNRRRELEAIERVYRLDDGKRLVSLLDVPEVMKRSGIEPILDEIACRPEREGCGTRERVDVEESVDGGNQDPQVVVFQLEDGEYGVSVHEVLEIVRRPEAFAEVPGDPSGRVAGIMNLRGGTVPVLDLRAALGLPPVQKNERQRILIVAHDEVRTGLLVDGVKEVRVIPAACVGPAPPMSAQQHLLLGELARLDEGRRLVMFLNTAAVLDPVAVGVGQELQA